jgi:hypothetical protein
MNNNNNNNSSSNNRMSWVSNSSLEDASDEDGNPQGSSPNGSDGRGGHGDNGDLPVPLSMINGLVPLISDSDIDEHDAKPLSHLELDKLESLQRDLAALLIRHAQAREGSEDGSSSSADDSSTASSSATMGPLHELLASLRAVGISYSDLPEAYQSREPSHYELALIDELLAAQVLNRKLKQKLQVIHHDPNMYHTVRYPALADVPVPPEYDPRYIAQSALRRRMTGAIGSEENLFEGAHDLLRKMRKLHADRSKDENFVGALLSDKYAIVNVGNVEGAGHRGRQQQQQQQQQQRGLDGGRPSARGEQAAAHAPGRGGRGPWGLRPDEPQRADAPRGATNERGGHGRPAEGQSRPAQAAG